MGGGFGGKETQAALPAALAALAAHKTGGPCGSDSIATRTWRLQGIVILFCAKFDVGFDQKAGCLPREYTFIRTAGGPSISPRQ